MINSLRLLVLPLTTVFALSFGTATAFAQDVDKDSSAPSQPQKKLKKKRQTRAPTADQDNTPGPTPTPSALFPSWTRPGFDWTLGPILGFSFTATTTPETGTVRTTTLEGGLQAGLTDIPLAPGNPGFGLGAHTAQSWGVINTVKAKDSDVKAEKLSYKRTVGGIDTSVYYRFLRNELGVTRGRIQYYLDEVPPVQSTRIRDDVGLLVLSWLSTHYTYTNLRAHAARYDQVLLAQHDHWVHARFFTSIAQIRFDVGPGFTQATEYTLNEEGYSREAAQGRTDYIQALTGLHLFWKLGASGQAKYIYNSTEEKLGTLAGVRLPEQELGQRSNVALPEDSVTASFFFGLTDLAYGIGVGWRYNLEILNLGRHEGRERITTKDHGLGLTYSATF